MGNDAYLPAPPDCPPQRLTREQLLPPTPSVQLDNKKQAFSPQLQEFCLKHPIAVVRGIAAALKLGPYQSLFNFGKMSKTQLDV